MRTIFLLARRRQIRTTAMRHFSRHANALTQGRVSVCGQCREHEHSYLSDAQYVAAVAALLNWIERKEKPTPAGIASRCAELDPSFVEAASQMYCWIELQV